MWHSGAWVHKVSMLRVFDLDVFPTRFFLECHQLSTTSSKLVIEIPRSWFLVVSILFFKLWMFLIKACFLSMFYPCFMGGWTSYMSYIHRFQPFLGHRLNRLAAGWMRPTGSTAQIQRWRVDPPRRRSSTRRPQYEAENAWYAHVCILCSIRTV